MYISNLKSAAADYAFIFDHAERIRTQPIVQHNKVCNINLFPCYERFRC